MPAAGEDQRAVLEAAAQGCDEAAALMDSSQEGLTLKHLEGMISTRPMSFLLMGVVIQPHTSEVQAMPLKPC